MGYLPIFLDLRGQPCLVIGGGENAQAKVGALLEADGIVTVVSTTATDGIKLLASDGRLRLLAREYEYGDLLGKSLVYVATGNAEISRRAALEARERGILLNVVDDPEASTFISPATFKRGDLQIAISTSGSSPALARMLRERLQQQIGPGYAALPLIMGRARKFLRQREADQHKRAFMLKSLATTLLDSVGALDKTLIDNALRRHLQATLEELAIEPSRIALPNSGKASTGAKNCQ